MPLSALYAVLSSQTRSMRIRMSSLTTTLLRLPGQLLVAEVLLVSASQGVAGPGWVISATVQVAGDVGALGSGDVLVEMAITVAVVAVAVALGREAAVSGGDHGYKAVLQHVRLI